MSVTSCALIVTVPVWGRRKRPVWTSSRFENDLTSRSTVDQVHTSHSGD
jgi:hypothetical protein